MGLSHIAAACSVKVDRHCAAWRPFRHSARLASINASAIWPNNGFGAAAFFAATGETPDFATLRAALANSRASARLTMSREPSPISETCR